MAGTVRVHAANGPDPENRGTAASQLVERAEERGKQFAREDCYALVLLLIVASIISTAFVGDGTLGLIALAVAAGIVAVAGIAGYVGLTRLDSSSR